MLSALTAFHRPLYLFQDVMYISTIGFVITNTNVLLACQAAYLYSLDFFHQSLVEALFAQWPFESDS